MKKLTKKQKRFHAGVSMLISFTRFIGFGLNWGGYWISIYLPFFVVDFYFPMDWGIKFENDWKL